MLALIAAGGARPSAELTEAERRALEAEYVQSAHDSGERPAHEVTALQSDLSAKQADLTKKSEAVARLKRDVIKLRLGKEGGLQENRR